MSNRFTWTNKGAVDQIIRDVVKHVGLEVERDTKELCPILTGTLRRSYSMAFSESGSTATATIGTGVHYAPYVELGTRYQRAQPHLGPALERARSKYS